MSEKNIKKPFYKKWWFIAIVVFFVLGGIGAALSEEDVASESKKDDTPVVAEKTEKEEPKSEKEDSKAEPAEVKEEPKEEPVVKYGSGMYKVGSDIEPGLYKAVVTDNIFNAGYIERSKSASMDFESIIANIMLTGNGYVRILDTDAYVQLNDVELTPFDLENATANFSDSYEDGIYIVGLDIAPGEYKVEVTDDLMGMGYVERMSDVTMGFDSIISNGIFEGQGYVEIAPGDFSVKLQSVILTPVN